MAAFELRSRAVLGDGRYHLRRPLGTGGMASVWLARDERLGRDVAIKVISEALAADERYRERFEREARAAASVSHPSIVPVFDYGLQGDRPFLVMEYLPGGSLADVISGRRPAAVDPVTVAIQILGALDCIHEAGLVHRDVKPANILLDSSGRARLTDFGIAQLDDAASLTQTGMVLGTLRYLAPELAEGTKADPTADLYSTGVVLRDLTELRPAPGLTALITALTEPDPGDRPPSARSALLLCSDQDVEQTAVQPTRRAAPPGVPRGGAPGVSRGISRRGAAPAGVAAALVVLILLLILLSGGASPPRGTSSASPGPAPAGTALSGQLRALRNMVDASTTR